MYNALIRKLKQQRKLYARTRRDYPEVARQAKINAQAIERQIKIANTLPANTAKTSPKPVS